LWCKLLSAVWVEWHFLKQEGPSLRTKELLNVLHVGPSEVENIALLGQELNQFNTIAYYCSIYQHLIVW
jgi:hypothetical protein